MVSTWMEIPPGNTSKFRGSCGSGGRVGHPLMGRSAVWSSGCYLAWQPPPLAFEYVCKWVNVVHSIPCDLPTKEMIFFSYFLVILVSIQVNLYSWMVILKMLKMLHWFWGVGSLDRSGKFYKLELRHHEQPWPFFMYLKYSHTEDLWCFVWSIQNFNVGSISHCQPCQLL